jgi:hypothetical protein
MIRRLFAVLVLGVAAGVGACKETFDGGAACPSLCPSQEVVIRDTILTPVLAFDSTFVGYPDRGNENGILLATRGDTLEVRGVVRFDTLPTFYPVVNDTGKTIVSVDSARARLIVDTTRATLPASVRFEVYDVDDTLALDTAAAPVLAKFTAANRLGTLTLPKDSVRDTVYVPIDNAKLLAKIQGKRRLRLGFRVDGSGSVSLKIQSVETGSPVIVQFRPTPDTTISKLTVSPISGTPYGEPDIQRDLQDFQLVAKNNLAATTNTMSVGGVPGRRAYLRFNLPKALTDSTTVIRATLRLVQAPIKFGGPRDSITIHTQVALASPLITDLRRAANIIGSPGLLVSDSLVLTPADSGVKTVELFGLVRAWASQSSVTNAPYRAVVLRAAQEALFPAEVRFYGTNAPAALRPTMRLSYIKKINYGVP